MSIKIEQSFPFYKKGQPSAVPSKQVATWVMNNAIYEFIEWHNSENAFDFMANELRVTLKTYSRMLSSYSQYACIVSAIDIMYLYVQQSSSYGFQYED